MTFRQLALVAGVCLLAACSDLAKIGALCPVGCTLGTAERVCECGAGAAGQGGAGGTGSASAADGGVAADGGAVSSEGKDASASGPTGMSAADAGAACASATGSTPSTQPGNLVVALDGSASLVPWWPALSEGFQRFLQEDASRGLGVGLLSFADVCDTTSYLSTLVPIATLPDNLAALQANIPTAAAATTSTIPVLNAALEYARTWLSTHSGARLAVLLITDASPGVCDGLTGMADAELSRIASEAFMGTPSIATYAIGGDSLPNIGPLAMAGGTQAITIQPLSTSDDVLNALRNIRGAVNGCAPSP